MLDKNPIPAKGLVLFLTGLLLGALAACGAPSPAAIPQPSSTLEPTLPPTPEPAPTKIDPPTPRPTSTPEPSPTATSTPVPQLTWDQLQNTAYPSDWSTEGLAQLEDGIYREKYLPDSATELVISLADIRTHGDLDGDGVDDVLVVLVSHPGGSGTFFDLAAVLNDNGQPKTVATAFLGDRTIIRSLTTKAGQIVVQSITQGPDDPMCCPNMDRRQVYALQDGDLALLEQVDTPRTEPAVPRHIEPEQILFAPSATSGTFEGTILPIGDRRYLLSGHAGQTLSLTITSPHDHVLLSVVGADGAVLVSILDEATSWTGQLPRSLNYLITLVSVAGNETTYSLHVQVSGQPAPAPGPTPTPTPSAVAGKVIYLTFDDGPAGPRWTPQILETLAAYQAKATFFVLGRQAQRYPELIQAETQAGHSVANHTFGHHTLDGIGREAFIGAIEAAQAALGGAAARCLRPPYGAMDAYTRAYAAELGYTLVLWNIDTLDWQRPGADVIAAGVVEQAHPGAIVLMHDGGGDRAQTHEALGIILDTLSRQGYIFQVVCR